MFALDLVLNFVATKVGRPIKVVFSSGTRKELCKRRICENRLAKPFTKQVKIRARNPSAGTARRYWFSLKFRRNVRGNFVSNSSEVIAFREHSSSCFFFGNYSHKLNECTDQDVCQRGETVWYTYIFMSKQYRIPSKSFQYVLCWGKICETVIKSW